MLSFDDKKMFMHIFHIWMTRTTVIVGCWALSSEMFVPCSCPDVCTAIRAAERLLLKSF